MIYKRKRLQVRAYHPYINLPRKYLFSAHVRELSRYRAFTVYWGGQEKKKKVQ